MMTDLTPKRLQELRRIAEAATPGPWWVDGWEARTKDGDRFIASIAPAFQGASPDASCWEVDANIQHIAAFDPTTTLALLDEIERLRREREEDDDKWTRYEELYVQARGQIIDLQLEIERLRRERDVLAEAFKHVLTCEDCECASCPEGTGLVYRAYRALKEGSRCDS